VIKIVVPKKALELDKKVLKAALRSAGSAIVKNARALIQNGGASGVQSAVRLRWNPHYKKSQYTRLLKTSRHTASAPGKPPSNLSGLLAASIISSVVSNRDGMGIKFVDTAHDPKGRPYGKFLEVGTHRVRGKRSHKKAQTPPDKMQPRPYLSKAVEDGQKIIEQKVEEALSKALQFVNRK
jgi:hypothetical protein